MKLMQNSLGWRLEKLFGWYIIKKSDTLRKSIFSLGPFWVNIVFISLFAVLGIIFTSIDVFTFTLAPICALPITFVYSYLIFQNAIFYVNRKRNIAGYAKNLESIKLKYINFKIIEKDGINSLIILDENSKKQYLAWKSENESEMKDIENIFRVGI